MIKSASLWEHPTVKRVCHICNMVWAISCMLVVPALIGGVVALHFQQPAVVAVQKTGLMTVVSGTFTPIRIDSPIGVHVDTKQVMYRPVVVDLSGTVVHRLPEVTTSPDVNTLFSIPPLPRGTYFLESQVLYPLNPVKTVQVEVTIARIEIF